MFYQIVRLREGEYNFIGACRAARAVLGCSLRSAHRAVCHRDETCAVVIPNNKVANALQKELLGFGYDLLPHREPALASAPAVLYTYTVEGSATVHYLQGDSVEEVEAQVYGDVTFRRIL